MKTNRAIVVILWILASVYPKGEEILEIRTAVSPGGSYATSPQQKSRPSREIFVEYRKAFGKNFQLGIGAGYKRQGKVKEYVDLDLPGLYVKVKETKLYDAIPVYVTARYNFNTDKEWVPFIRANLGYSFHIHSNQTNKYETISKSDSALLDAGDLRHFRVKDGFYYSLGAGLAWKHFTLSLSYDVHTAKLKTENYLFQKSAGRADFSGFSIGFGYEFPFRDRRAPDYVEDDRRILSGAQKKKARADLLEKKEKRPSHAFSGEPLLKEELPKEQRDFFNRAGQSPQTAPARQNDRDDPRRENLPKFPIHAIYVLDELQLLDKATKNEIIGRYEGRELTLPDIRDLGGELNEAFAKKGYVTTKVMLPGQDITSGQLKLAVIYGKIEEILLDADSARDRRKIRAAFPLSAGDVLDIAALDQGVDNLNRLESNNAKMDVAPGDLFAYSDILVKSDKTKKWRIKLAYDDLGEEKRRMRATLELDDLAGINDSFSVYYSGRSDNFARGKSKRPKTDAYGLSYSFPVKNRELFFTAAGSDEITYERGAVSAYEIRTKTEEFAFYLESLLFRNQDHKIKTSLGLSIKKENTWLDRTKLLSQERNFSVFHLGVSGIGRIFGGMASWSLRYEQGVKLFGAKEDLNTSIGVLTDPGPLDSDKKYQFGKASASFSWYRPFSLGKQRFTFRAQAAGQYTADNLFASERISIGGFDTVRGYSRSISGDIGFYTRTELAWILPGSGKNGKWSQFFFKLRPYAAFDFGKTRDNFDAAGKRGGPVTTAAGYGIGVHYYGNRITLDAGVLKGDRPLPVGKRDRFRAFVAVSMTF
ncbi:MAG: outer membrane beta-barrel protein [Fusobacteriaceae bacterium]|jgi:hemolysin activation/secretion protein|nr:outer membrane beta-barrel protein [Fusobacteriaceae bacterium]